MCSETRVPDFCQGANAFHLEVDRLSSWQTMYILLVLLVKT